VALVRAIFSLENIDMEEIKSFSKKREVYSGWGEGKKDQ
jgi:hypothetical protein